MTVTLKQIAKQSGLSIQTVSQILNGKGALYLPDTCERVQQAALALGYRPHSSARAMRTGHYDCLALLLSTGPYRSTLFEGLLDGIQSALKKADQHLTLAKMSDEELTDETFVPKMLRELLADGVLIHYTNDIPERLREMVRRYALPCVWVNSPQDADCVRPDDFAGGRQATEHLIRLGHTRIAYATVVTRHYSSAERRRGYQQAMHEAGLVPQFIEELGVSEQWLILARQWLSKVQRPTAFVTHIPFIAQTIAYAAAGLGLNVPQDLSLVTFHESMPDEIGLPLTTCLVPNYAMGQAAVRMLLTKIQAPTVALPPGVIPFGFVQGESSAQAPHG